MALLDFRELDLEEIRDVGRERSAGLFGWPVEPDFEVLNSFIRGKGGASEHCVGGEESFASWFGADEILQGLSREVNAIRNEEGVEFVAGEESLNCPARRTSSMHL